MSLYLLLFIFFISCFLLFLKNKKQLSPTIQANNSISLNDATKADLPENFGYKCVWIAVKNANQKLLIEILNLKETQHCNWKKGIEKAYQNGIFITPNIDCWTLICGRSLPWGDTIESKEKLQNLLNELSLQFDEAHFYATYRVSDYHAWMKSCHGKVIRAFAIIGIDTIYNEGEPTVFETQFNLVDTTSKAYQEDENYFDRDDLTYPDEDFVMLIADRWSIAPNTIEERTDIEESLGVIGIL
ncbi:hypothetical protein [Flavobacterium sp.]|uniref:hypothetical protein n=1 Tax=Flavobacterium sp. TaxID=239 RepID=UPI003D0BBE80